MAAAVLLARDAVDGLRRHRVLRRSAERVSSESALRGARASAALAGADLPLDVVRRTARSDSEPGSGPVRAEDADTALEGVVQGALRVAAELGGLSGTWKRAPMQALARLHTLAAADLAIDANGLGRPQPAAAARLQGLAAVLTGPTAAPALVVAAVVHGELATMGAFEVGSGVVARAASRLTLAGRGLDPSAVSVPEVGHVELGHDAYVLALRGYLDGGPDGVVAWIAHCAEAVVLGAREGVAICEALQRTG